MAELNPQRLSFKEYYCNPASETFNLIEESALKAGFSESYAKVLLSDSTGNDWVKNIIKNYKLKSKAERNLNNLLDSKDEKVKADMTKFTLKTLGKDEYSERTEITGAEGRDLGVILYPQKNENTLEANSKTD
jgi:phage terminase small subunit